jgi:hypothetical protein
LANQRIFHLEISQAKNWARITYLVLFLLGALFYVAFLRTAFHRSMAVSVLMILQSSMQLAALVIIFVTPAKDWFNVSKKASA